jgi:predicted RecA/RadA family phage recombinase
MAFNVRPGGNHIPVPVPETINSGDLVRVDAFVGIAEIDATEGDDGLFYTTLAVEGVANSPITGAVTVGDPLYTATAGPGLATLTTATTAGNKFVGIATTAKGSGAGTVWYKLVPSATVTV